MSSCFEHSIDSSSSPSIVPSRYRGIEASRYRGIEASRHRAIEASRYRGIEASRHRGIARLIERVIERPPRVIERVIERPASTSTPVDLWALALGLGECQLARRGTPVRPLFGGRRPLSASVGQDPPPTPGGPVSGGRPPVSASARFRPPQLPAVSGFPFPGFRFRRFCGWTTRFFWLFLAPKSLSGVFLRRTWVFLRLWPFRAFWRPLVASNGLRLCFGPFRVDLCVSACATVSGRLSEPTVRAWPLLAVRFPALDLSAGFAWFSPKGFPADSGSGFGFFVFGFSWAEAWRRWRFPRRSRRVFPRGGLALPARVSPVFPTPTGQRFRSGWGFLVSGFRFRLLVSGFARLSRLAPCFGFGRFCGFLGFLGELGRFG